MAPAYKLTVHFTTAKKMGTFIGLRMESQYLFKLPTEMCVQHRVLKTVKYQKLVFNAWSNLWSCLCMYVISDQIELDSTEFILRSSRTAAGV